MFVCLPECVHAWKVERCDTASLCLLTHMQAIYCPLHLADQCRRSICGDSYTLFRLHVPPSQVHVTHEPRCRLSRWQHLWFPQSHLSTLLTVTTAILSLWVTNSSGLCGTAGETKTNQSALLIFFTWNGGIGAGLLANLAGSSDAIQSNSAMAF